MILRFIRHAGAFVLVAVAVYAFQVRSGFLSGASLLMMDAGQSLLARLYYRPDPRIVEILIDQTDLDVLRERTGMRWPWSREIHAELLDGLLKAGARAVAYDILFDEPSPLYREGDLAFAAIANDARVYLPSAFDRDGKLGRPWLERGLWQSGFIDLETDRNGIVRFVPARKAGEEFFALAVARGLGHARDPAESERVIPAWSIYPASGQTHRQVAFSELWARARSTHAAEALGEFRDKIVLIGVSAPGLYDVQNFPVARSWPGTALHAAIIDSALNDRLLRYVPSGSPAHLLAFCLMAALCYGMLAVRMQITRSLMSQWAKRIASFSLIPGLFMLTALAATGLLLAGVYLDVFESLLIGLLASLTGSQQMLERAQRLFGGKLEYAEGWHARPTRTQVIVLFTDIRGFTAFCASQEGPAMDQAIVAVGNYLSEQVSILRRHGATVDKFIGDAIMAWWPQTPDNHTHAAQCLVQLMDNARTSRFRVLVHGEASDEMAVSGFGMHCGPAYECCLGNVDRFEHALLGSTINIAARLESATRSEGIAVVSAAWVEAMGEAEFGKQLAMRGYQLNACEPLALKGLPLPLAAWAICPT